jgi:sigma-E factor negative regulatory protein RseA
MKQQDENLSLLLDDFSDADVDSVLDEVIADVNLQYRVRRYRMIGDVMRNELPAAIDTGFHQQVMARIGQQPQPADPVGKPAAGVTSHALPLMARAWFKPFAGLAVAASVALVTVALWQPLQPESALTDASLASADEQKIQQLAGQQIAGGAVPVSTRVQSEGMRWKLQNESPVLEQKLNAYLVNHTEYSNSMQGLIPQARVVGFDAQQ